ncbi:HNH endonuclease family protein [Kibdelosporangium persicum]|uniref:Extracellular deoxyribonuclease n=1 Tax=Kibdelosporangium persicum TaxID=2698649 RepID=A0ABX2F6V4_9PSEU|nr:HNH endonuclease family protein [Kibdelosporangium persicum]NRN66695.1 Extracellular deoxyribonuclease [Kibdelosporangium persicum]
MIRVVLLVLLLSGCAALPTGPNVPITHVPPGTPDAATARTQLAALVVQAPASLAGYVRSCESGAACVFGRPWIDVDGDGCDQRSQVLARDLSGVSRKEGRCAVTSGTLQDPYTGDTVTSVSKIQIDHVVPLAEMWRSGASTWTLDRRALAANDLRNLVAVQGKTNQAKGDQTPDQWMPPNTGYACPYARIYVGVKAAYALTTTTTERAALDRALAACP